MEVSGRRTDFTAETKADDLDQLCEVCEVDGVTTSANGICRECHEYMCSTCFRYHLKAKSCRHHILIDINQIETVTAAQIKAVNVEKCRSHATEIIKYYCRKHETVGCGDCMIPVHGPCKPENIKDLSKQFHNNKEFKSLVGKLQNLTEANLENDKKVQENKKANKSMFEKALKEIKCFRTEINYYLDKAEASITKEATDIERQNDKLLAKIENDCKLFSTKIMEVRQKLDKELYQDSALFIQTVYCTPIVLDIEREVSRIQRENDIRTFEFLPDKQLQKIVTSIEKLGSFGKNESKSPAKADTTGMIQDVSSGGTAAYGKQSDPIQEKREMGLEQAQQSAVGARVRAIGVYATGYFCSQVFQNRFNGSVDFYRNFANYTVGFGTLNGEFWLGLDYLHEIVSQGSSELRIDVTAADGSSGYETFCNFSISVGPNYTLHISRGTGTIGDQAGGLVFHNSMHFSTFDHDMDTYYANCAERFHGAWWFKDCMGFDLNGIYFTPGTVDTSSVSYNIFTVGYESLKSSKMMLRRV